MYQFESDDPVRHLTRIENRLHTYVVQTFWHPLILPELPGKALRNGAGCHLDCNASWLKRRGVLEEISIGHCSSKVRIH